MSCSIDQPSCHRTKRNSSSCYGMCIEVNRQHTRLSQTIRRKIFQLLARLYGILWLLRLQHPRLLPAVRLPICLHPRPLRCTLIHVDCGLPCPGDSRRAVAHSAMHGGSTSPRLCVWKPTLKICDFVDISNILTSHTAIPTMLGGSTSRTCCRQLCLHLPRPRRPCHTR
jgi:hypothetical protein